MAHDGLGHAAEHPTPHAGAPMRAHSDQRVEAFSRRFNNFVRFETFFSCKRDFVESPLFHPVAFKFEILHSFGTATDGTRIFEYMAFSLAGC